MIDWKSFFRQGNYILSGQLRSFHIVFEIRVLGSGRFITWSDDGAIIEKDGLIVHEDRTAHPCKRSEISVLAGDRLRIAHWQLHGDWLWGACLHSPELESEELLLKFLPEVESRLRGASGPCLKMVTDGSAYARAVLAIYSMILNGYVPKRVLLFGEHQWSSDAKSLFSRCLPFVEIIPTASVLRAVREAGGNSVATWAMQAWWIMKTCAALFSDSKEFCMMDDDVFVLSSVDDALEYFISADLVYQSDFDHGDKYRRIWGPPGTDQLPTSRFNAGLYWMRNNFEIRAIAQQMLRVPPQRAWHVAWEQGFIATLFARCRSLELFCGSRCTGRSMCRKRDAAL